MCFENSKKLSILDAPSMKTLLNPEKNNTEKEIFKILFGD